MKKYFLAITLLFIATTSFYANNNPLEQLPESKVFNGGDLIDLVQKDVTYTNLLNTISSINNNYFVDENSMLSEEKDGKWAVQLAIKNSNNNVAGYYYLASSGVSFFQDISDKSNKIVNYNLNDGSVTNFVIQDNQIKKVIDVNEAMYENNLKEMPPCDASYVAMCIAAAVASGTGTFGFGVCMLFCE